MYKFIFISLLFFFTRLNAQWMLLNPYPTTNTLYSLSVPNDTCFFSGGLNGIFIKSTDSARTWTSHKVSKYFVSDIHFFDSESGLVTSDTGVLRTENGGATWNKTSDKTINVFNFLNTNIGWAAGHSLVLKTINGGQSWSAIYDVSGTNYNILCIEFIDEKNGWVAGLYGSPLRTTNGGNTWNGIYFNPGFSNEALDLDFIDVNNGWLLSNGAAIYKTTDGGITWTRKSFAQGLTGIQAVTLQVLYAAGDNGLYKSSDGGNNWLKMYNRGIQNFKFKDEFNGYAVSGYTIIKTTDGGITWNSVSGNITSNQLNAVDFCDNNNGVIVGENGTILTTGDRGLNWHVNNSAVGNLNDIKFQKNKTGWIAGTSSLLLTSSDFGKSWVQKHVSSSNSNFKSVSFLSDDHGIIASHIGILYYTSDGGNKWDSVSIGPKYLINSVHYLNENTVWAACDSGIILKISNGQISKECRLIPYQLQFYDLWIRPYTIHFFDELNGIVAAGDYDQFNQARNGWIYKTTDGGNTWNIKKKRTEYGLGWQLNIKSLHVIDSTNVIAVSQNGEIFKSIDNGESWGTQSSPVNFSLNGIYFFNNNEGLIIGNNGLILSTLNGGGDLHNITTEVKADENNDIPMTGYNLSQNYPNPFNPLTTIRFSIPKSDFVSLKVYDLLGKEVGILVNENKNAGEFLVDFNASDLSSGIYLYRLKSGTFIGTKKLIILK